MEACATWVEAGGLWWTAICRVIRDKVRPIILTAYGKVASTLADAKKPIIVTTLAGFFLLAAIAVHAYVTPVPLTHDDAVWVQYGKLHFLQQGEVVTP